MTTTQTLTTYTIKTANAFHWADFHVNAASEEEAREKMREVAEEGTLADTAEEEYEMAVADDRYDPDRSDYTYRIHNVEAAGDYDQRADGSPHHLSSGGNG
jgi:phosphoribosylformylglycinamidine (FGAM) synthase PurS component